MVGYEFRGYSGVVGERVQGKDGEYECEKGRFPGLWWDTNLAQLSDLIIIHSFKILLSICSMLRSSQRWGYSGQMVNWVLPPGALS